MPHQPDDPAAVAPVDYPPDFDEGRLPAAEHSADADARKAPHVIRVRLAAWDVLCTVALLVLLVVLATATTWPARLFGFLEDVCEGDTCGPVPYGVDMYIHPVVWGGVGAAVAAAVVGPVVSVLKGWYMSFWPVLALALVMVTSVAGSMLTIFSERYWL